MFKNNLPNFIICGAQKSGTTSLFKFLGFSSEISLSKTKEVHYFDFNYHKGIDWYKSYFNFTSKKKIEASPSYLLYEKVPERIFKSIKKVKLIFLLRNPVQRAISHYWHEVKLGVENRPFDKVFFNERRRIIDEYSLNHFSYLKRGLYLEQINNFKKFFKDKNILILKSENLFQKNTIEFKKLFDFLEIDPISLKNFKGKETLIYPKIKPENMKVINYLENFFKNHNEKLKKKYDNLEWKSLS